MATLIFRKRGLSSTTRTRADAVLARTSCSGATIVGALAPAHSPVQLHRRAMSGFAVQANVPPGLFDELIGDAQPKAAPFARLLGGEERIEGPIEDLRRHAHAGIADREQHIVAGRHFLELTGIFLI